MNIIHVPGNYSEEAARCDVVHAPTKQHDKLLQQQLDDIAVQKAVVIGSITHITDKIRAMYEDLNSANSDVQSIIRTLMHEKAELEAEVRKQIYESAQPDDLDSEFAETFEYSYGSYEEDNSETERLAESPELVKLFRQIANKTHPDKSDDPALNMLFITAKACRRNGDLNGLKEIWSFINGAVSSLLSKMLKVLTDALQELAMLKQNLNTLRCSEDYTLVNFYSQDREAVRQMSRMQMEGKRDQLYAHVRMLRQNLGRSAPVRSIIQLGSA